MGSGSVPQMEAGRSEGEMLPSDGHWEHEVPGHLWGWCPWGSEAGSYPTQPSTPFLLSHPIVAQFSEPPKMRPVGFCWKAGVNQMSCRSWYSTQLRTCCCCCKLCTFMKFPNGQYPRARTQAKYFMATSPLLPHSHLRSLEFLGPFSRCANIDPQKESHLPKSSYLEAVQPGLEQRLYPLPPNTRLLSFPCLSI